MIVMKEKDVFYVNVTKRCAVFAYILSKTVSPEPQKLSSLFNVYWQWQAGFLILWQEVFLLPDYRISYEASSPTLLIEGCEKKLKWQSRNVKHEALRFFDTFFVASAEC